MKLPVVVGGVYSTQHQHAAFLIPAGGERGGRADCLVEVSGLGPLDLVVYPTASSAGVPVGTHTALHSSHP